MLNDDQSYFTEEDERDLEAGFVKLFTTSNPNPTRKGCPDPKLIRDVAFRRCTKEQFMAVVEHLSQCSPCSREARIFAEEYKDFQRLSRREKNSSEG